MEIGTKFEILNSKFKTNSEHEARNSKQIQITNPRRYDLEERSLIFGKRIIRLCKALPRNTTNEQLTRQVIRSGTSVGANYREANETDTKKDFKHRIRIAKKEAKETTYWLELIIEANFTIKEQMTPLLNESQELMRILGSIYENAKETKKTAR